MDFAPDIFGLFDWSKNEINADKYDLPIIQSPIWFLMVINLYFKINKTICFYSKFI